MMRRREANDVVYVYDDVETNESFEQKCQRISRNDPTIRTVDAVSNTFLRQIWCGYGPRLGKALLSNTVVTRIDLAPDLFYTADKLQDSDQDKEAAPMLQYLRSSKTLRTVRLDADGNDEEYEEWSDFDPNDADFCLAGKILLSMAHNPNIVTFMSTVELPLAEFTQFLTSKATNVRTVRLEKSAMVHFRNAALFAEAIAMNRSIQTLFMNCVGNLHAEHVVRRLDDDHGNSSSSNTGPVTKVTVAVTKTTSMKALLTSTLTLQTLVLEKITFHDSHATLLCTALASNLERVLDNIVCEKVRIYRMRGQHAGGSVPNQGKSRSKQITGASFGL
jgi:hypothetical protein